MSRKWIAGLALVAALATPAVGVAHKGHAHKVMGTVSSIDGKHIMVKTTDGKTAMVMLDANTKITQGKAKVTRDVLKVGARIVAEGAQEKDILIAATVQVGTAAPAAAAKN